MPSVTLALARALYLLRLGAAMRRRRRLRLKSMEGGGGECEPEVESGGGGRKGGVKLGAVGGGLARGVCGEPHDLDPGSACGQGPWTPALTPSRDCAV
eukprot:282750-Rhodomonas_salina.2